jgi:hypothetical protein
MPWGAAIGAVATVAGSAISGGKGGGGGKTSQSQSTPWDIAQQQQGLANQQGLYNFRMANGPYQGSFYSPINSTQTGAAQQATNWTGSQGQADANAMWNTAQQLQAGAPQYQQNAFNAAQNGLVGGPNQAMMGTLQGYGNGSQTTQGANPTLGQSLELAGTWGAQALAGFQGNLQDAAGRAGQDATNQVSQDASAYATNPYVQSAINNANNQIDTTLNESTVPGLNRAASQGGALNSSRAGMAEAEANRGAALAKGNADSSIVNNAYSQGLNTAGNLYSSGLNAQINAGSLGYNDMGNLSNSVANQQQALHEFNTNTQLNAAQAGLASDLNYRNANAQTQLAGNQQLGTSVGQGIGAGDGCSTGRGCELRTRPGRRLALPERPERPAPERLPAMAGDERQLSAGPPQRRQQHGRHVRRSGWHPDRITADPASTKLRGERSGWRDRRLRPREPEQRPAGPLQRRRRLAQQSMEWPQGQRHGRPNRVWSDVRRPRSLRVKEYAHVRNPRGRLRRSHHGHVGLHGRHAVTRSGERRVEPPARRGQRNRPGAHRAEQRPGVGPGRVSTSLQAPRKTTGRG